MVLDKLAQVQEQLDATQGPEEIYLWPECEEAWNLFWQLHGQWHSSDMGGKTGLSLACVRAHLDELGYEHGDHRKELWRLLLDCQNAALEAYAELQSSKP